MNSNTEHVAIRTQYQVDISAMQQERWLAAQEHWLAEQRVFMENNHEKNFRMLIQNVKQKVHVPKDGCGVYAYYDFLSDGPKLNIVLQNKYFLVELIAAICADSLSLDSSKVLFNKICDSYLNHKKLLKETYGLLKEYILAKYRLHKVVRIGVLVVICLPLGMQSAYHYNIVCLKTRMVLNLLKSKMQQ